MIANAPPIAEQTRDFDFLAAVGELFTLLVYGHLIIEAVKVYRGMYDVSDELLDQIFEVFVRDFSKFAVELMAKPSATEKQIEYCRKMVKRPVPNQERFEKVLKEVYSLKDAYEMNP